MFFRLRTFAQQELKNYTVTRRVNTIGVGEVTETPNDEFIYPMLIYKSDKFQYNKDLDDAGDREGRLNGKIEKKYDLKSGDRIVVEGINFEIKYIVPRLFSDFKEFEMVMLDGY